MSTVPGLSDSSLVPEVLGSRYEVVYWGGLVGASEHAIESSTLSCCKSLSGRITTRKKGVSQCKGAPDSSLLIY